MPKKDVRKEVRYLSRDFQGFRNSLIDYSKTYFPNTYNDFNETSPGMMFIEMAAYVGDVLSFYVDSQFKELLLAYAEERKNVVGIAETFGYKVKPTVPANTEITVYQTVPDLVGSAGTGDNQPDLRYALRVEEGMIINSTSIPNVKFITTEEVNFKVNSKNDPMEMTVYQKDGSGFPQYWLLKKKVKAKVGTKKSETFTFGSPIKYNKIELSENDITDILSVKDADGNTWYEVPYLAQDTMFKEVANTSDNDPEMAQYNETAPYMLRLRKTSRRFITRVNSDNITELRFGAGISDNPDEEIIPTPDNVGSQLPGSPSKLDFAYDPSNFLYTRTYGLVPSNTTLTVEYIHGGGIESNVPAKDLQLLGFVPFADDNVDGLNASIVQQAKESLAVINDEPASGGRNAETIEEIRNNALAHFSTQNRAVTKEDYITRVYSLPPRYGNIAKVFITQDDQLQGSANVVVTTNNSEKSVQDGGEIKDVVSKLMGTVDGGKEGMPSKAITKVPNPFALNLYCLGYDSTKRLINLNPAVKENLKNYLSQYRILTDAINIKNAYVINIALEFDISVLKNYNKREVLAGCIKQLKEYFDIDKWQINQPIVKGDVIYQLSLVDGVQNVIDLRFENKWNTEDGYSGNVYDMKEANRNEVVYPSADPSIFEIKYPNQDIVGKAL
tara:strand:+ start:928 stop:2937 length:2010 start_codon:yes stop_codon:yes gene_type:complete